MEIMKTFVLNICVLLAVSGCAHHFSDVSPYVKAQTIDAATNKPISGAVAYCIERPNIRAISDSDGILKIIKAKEQIRYFPFGPWSNDPPDCTLIIKATGCEDIKFESIRKWDIDKGIIYMRNK